MIGSAQHDVGNTKSMTKTPSRSYQITGQDGLVSRQDSLTVGHLANRIAGVPLQKGLTTSHLAQGLGSSTPPQGQSTAPQTPASGAGSAPAEPKAKG